MSRPAAPGDVLGVILAGGENRRYGAHKAFAMLGDSRIIDLVVDAMRQAVDGVTIVANDLDRYGPLGLPLRSDSLPGMGALGGILTAVHWARDLGCRAALVAACDMPFLHPLLLRQLVARAEPDRVCFPESRGPRGVEPLCAAYGIDCARAIEAALRRGERTVVQALAGVGRRTVPLRVVARFGDPDLLFLNVNRPTDRARAEELLSRSSGEGSRSR